MKRSKITSFLFTIALGLFAFSFGYSQATNSADCQDLVNISLGESCNVAIPFEAFNTEEPACMLIKNSNGEVVAALKGTGLPADSDPACTVEIDSMWLTRVDVSNDEVNEMAATFVDCGGGETLYIAKSDYVEADTMNNVCSRAVRFSTTEGDFAGAAAVDADVVIVLLNKGDEVPTECGGVFMSTPGFIQITDTKVTSTVTVNNKTVERTDTFHTTLEWVKGTQILVDADGDEFIVNGYIHRPEPGMTTEVVFTCGVDASFTAGVTHSSGPAKLGVGDYTYESYTADGLNHCWGNIKTEFKLTSNNAVSKADTISCADLVDFSRASGKDVYEVGSLDKLEDLVSYLESAGISRTDADVEKEIKDAAPCISYEITHKDEWLKNFDWLCDTVAVARKWSANPSVGEATEIGTDTVLITPIPIEDVVFPDSIIVMDCGIIADDSPTSIAEYLRESYNKEKASVITEPNIGGSEYVTADPCETFLCQYNDNDISVAVGSSFNNCVTAFTYADYNNWGVERAYPHIVRNTSAVDNGLKARYEAAALSGDISDYDVADDVSLSHVSVPINKVVCNIVASYSDLAPIDICVGERKIFRNWSLVDWCTGTTMTRTQVIKYVDRFAPTVTTWEGLVPYDATETKDDYFGNNTAGDHLTALSSTVLEWIDTTDVADYDGDGDRAENAPWNQDNSMYTKYEKVTNPWNCTVTHTFPVMAFKDHCSDATYSFEIVNLSGDTDGKTYQAGQSVSSTWTFENGLSYPIVRVSISDDCGNGYEYYYYLKASDELPPVVVLHDKVSVTLTPEDAEGIEAIAKVFCNDLDAGSHDGACGALGACEIRRKGSDDAWADHVKFDCDDSVIGEVEVEYRAIDQSGNSAIGWAVVEVVNKAGSVLVCEDKLVGCDDAISPEFLGYPTVFGICSVPELEYEDERNVDPLCYSGTIKRTWKVKDGDAQCVQIITISSEGDSDLDPTSIRWPLHHTGENWATFINRHDGTSMNDVVVYEGTTAACVGYQFTTPITETNVSAQSYSDFKEMDADARTAFLEGCKMNDHFECELGDLTEPTWTDPVCGLVGKSFNDEHFKFNDGVCFKIIRRWAIIDWCTYDANDDASDEENSEDGQFLLVKNLCESTSYFQYDASFNQTDGYYTWEQEIKVVDDTPPVVTVEDVTADVSGGGKNSNEACVGSTTVTASAEDFCGANLVQGEEGTKEAGPELDWYLSIQQVDSEGEAIGSPSAFVLISNGGNEVGGDLVYSHENSYASVETTIEGKSGEHYVLKWRVIDGCNNAAEMESHVWFESKAPVLICYGDLSTNAMSTDGTTEIWASDFGTAQNCEGDEIAVYFKDADGNATPTLTLTCDDLGGNTSFTWEGRVYAATPDSTEAFCEVTLRVVDSNNACGENSGSSGLISGEVRTALGDMVEKARVSMDAAFEETSIEGKYAFHGITGNSYDIAASKDDNYMNGVSTLDLVLIQKHILGLKSLDSPYKVIAADINNDSQISSIDLVQLRKLILGLYDGDVLPNNDSWRFADAAQTFENATSPFPFVEKIDIKSLSTDRSNDDFIAMKIGDVSGDAVANSGIASGRTTSTLNLFANESSLAAGENVSVTISSDNFVDMHALQFTLNTAGLELVSVSSGAIEMDENSIAIHDNAISVAWFSENAVSTTKALFTFEFRATSNVALSNALSISSHITEAKAYDVTAEGFDVALTFNTGEGTVDGATFELFQNTPNPFEANTRIAFQLGQAGPATLTVFDVTGKTVKVVKGQFERGLNSISIESNELGVSGVLYYQLESGNFVATRKMILVR